MTRCVEAHNTVRGTAALEVHLLLEGVSLEALWVVEADAVELALLVEEGLLRLLR